MHRTELVDFYSIINMSLRASRGKMTVIQTCQDTRLEKNFRLVSLIDMDTLPSRGMKLEKLSS